MLPATEPTLTTALVGPPVDRADGRLKVTGAARYAAEYAPPNLAHAVLVPSAISKGRTVAIDASAAEAAPGVLAVLTHTNSLSIKQAQSSGQGGGGGGPRSPGLRLMVDGDRVAF